MKVMFCTREYPPNVYGGAGVHVEYLARELSRLMTVEVRSFGDQDEASINLEVKGFPFETDEFESADKKLKSIFKTLKTSVLMSSEPMEADVIHCHTWYSHFAGIISKLCYDIPLVVTTHSLEPLRPWKREQLGGGYDASSWIERTAIEMADAIIAVSEETKDDVLRHFDVDKKKVQVIYNGIDLKEYQVTQDTSTLMEYNIEPNKPIVLFVGRITRQKGIIHLVNALQHINSDAQIVLCAGAPDTEEIGREMEKRVEIAKNKREGIIWIDKMLDKKEIIQIYSHADVFCCPSIYEPFGIINIEAMACKTAVVASAVGGIKEVVVDGETGLLIDVEQQIEAPFEPVDANKFAKDLADGINKVLDNEPLRTKMANNGRKRVEELFDWTAIAAQTKDLYTKIIS